MVTTQSSGSNQYWAVTWFGWLESWVPVWFQLVKPNRKRVYESRTRTKPGGDSGIRTRIFENKGFLGKNNLEPRFNQ
jgi:hypothetical protein